jgi:dTDP-4-dehydrorhamnose reductase
VTRILLLGKSGQLGWELQRSLAPLGEVIALDRGGGKPPWREPSSSPLCGDLGRPEQLAATVLALRPQVIVNAAAYTAVDRAESESEVAYAVNALAPGTLAEASATLGACLIHYSTDYVFDGSGSRPWKEDDPTEPLGVYGRTKLEGEQRVRSSGCRHVILRTSWVYAARGTNFPKTMLRLASERAELSVIDDQIGAPTGADLIADATAHVLRTIEREGRHGGTYHVTASGEASWFEFAKFVIEGARSRGWPLTVPPLAIRPVPTSAYPSVARRPLNSRLDCTRFEQDFDLRLPRWQDGVERLLDELAPPVHCEGARRT